MKPRTKIESLYQFFYKELKAIGCKNRKDYRYYKRRMTKARRRFNKLEQED